MWGGGGRHYCGVDCGANQAVTPPPPHTFVCQVHPTVKAIATLEHFSFLTLLVAASSPLAQH